jgi:hypothetical protein
VAIRFVKQNETPWPQINAAHHPPNLTDRMRDADILQDDLALQANSLASPSAAIIFIRSRFRFAWHTLYAAQRPKLSDGGHETRRLQPRWPAAVRCSRWLGSRYLLIHLPPCLCARLSERDEHQ